jgi:hypothetical protein
MMLTIDHGLTGAAIEMLSKLRSGRDLPQERGHRLLMIIGFGVRREVWIGGGMVDERKRCAAG